MIDLRILFLGGNLVLLEMELGLGIWIAFITSDVCFLPFSPWRLEQWTNHQENVQGKSHLVQ